MKSLLMKKSNKFKWLVVSAGVLKNNEKLLLGVRPQGNSLAGYWEFPGGKIELDESPEEALVRELKEELGIDAEVGQLLLASSHSYGDLGLLILFYSIKYWKGTPQNIHHEELKWFTKDEVTGLKIPDANKKVLPQILDMIY